MKHEKSVSSQDQTLRREFKTQSTAVFCFVGTSKCFKIVMKYYFECLIVFLSQDEC